MSRLSPICSDADGIVRSPFGSPCAHFDGAPTLSEACKASSRVSGSGEDEEGDPSVSRGNFGLF